MDGRICIHFYTSYYQTLNTLHSCKTTVLVQNKVRSEIFYILVVSYCYCFFFVYQDLLFVWYLVCFIVAPCNAFVFCPFLLFCFSNSCVNNRNAKQKFLRLANLRQVVFALKTMVQVDVYSKLHQHNRTYLRHFLRT